MIEKTEQEGQIRGVKIAATTPSVTNLCFANDTMIFSRALRYDAMELKGMLDRYAKASGQVINFEKSSLTFSRGMQPAEMDQIAHILGVQVVEAHDKIWGCRRWWGIRNNLYLALSRSGCESVSMDGARKISLGPGKRY